VRAPFAYWKPGAVAPTVSAIVPNVADTAGGGGIVTITGTGFITGATVTLGGTAATSVTVVNSTTITCIPGARAAAASLSVVVTTSGGSNGANTLFEYWTPAQLTGADLYFDAGKGVTGSPTVTSWVDQTSSVSGTATASPSIVSSVFGTLPAIRLAPQARFGITRRNDASYDAGISVFFVGKWSATRTAVTQGFGVVPLSIFGDQITGNDSIGASAGNIAYSLNGSATIGTRGSSLNDNVARLIGCTFVQSTNSIRAYVGATQQGATDTGQTYPGAGGMGIDTIGNGYGTTDGWDGDLGAVILTKGATVIAGTDLTKLNSWAKQRWGTP
jgi:hypothetical protein